MDTIEDGALQTALDWHLATDPIVKYFSWQHLTHERLRETTKRFAVQAAFILEDVPRNAERTAGLRKLLEAKDCIVRAAL